MFSCEFCEISKNTSFTERLRILLLASRLGGSAVGCGILGAGSGFRVGWRAAGGWVAIFRDFCASASEAFILAVGLGAGLSFYGV